MASVISAGTTSTTALNLSGDTTGVLQLQTNGTTAAMTINTSQNVGIGTTSPSSILHIASSSQPTFKILYTAQREYGLTVTGGATTDGLAIRDESGSAEIARFCRSGNVGIGTTSPLARLDVRSASAAITSGSGNISIFSTDSQGVNLGGTLVLGGNADTQIAFGSIAGRKENSTTNNRDGYLQFSTYQNGVGNVERMRIDSSGNVGIGVSSIASSNKVQVSLASNTPTTGSPATGSIFNIQGGTTTVGDGPSLQLSNFSGAKETAWRISPVTTSGNNGDLVINGYTGGATYPERARFTNAGSFIVQASVSVGGVTPSASGAGITFPATQSASSDANTLDDYEEGTFTPSIVQGLTSVTYSVQIGRYTKVGRIAYFSVYLNVSGGTQNANNIQISLPFTSATTSGTFAGGAYWTYAGVGIVNSTSTNLPTLYIGSAVTSFDLYNTAGGNFFGTNLAGSTPVFYIAGWMECA